MGGRAGVMGVLPVAGARLDVGGRGESRLCAGTKRRMGRLG